VWIKREILKHHRDRLAINALTTELNFPAVWKFEARNKSKQSSLAASRGAEQDHKFSAPHGQGNVKYASARREPPSQVLDCEFGHSRYRELPAISAPRKEGPSATTTQTAGIIISIASALAGPTLPNTV